MSIDRNPQFQRWFGRSKVVDSGGRPLRVFHGTCADITAFDISLAGKNTGGKWDWGLFFTNNNIHEATGVIDAESGERILHDVASTTYFAKVASQGRLAADTAHAAFVGASVMPVYVSLQNPLVIDKTGCDTAVNYFDRHQERLKERMLAVHHDGIIIRDPLHEIDGEPETLVVATDPCQIKSAIGNSGAFDPRDPDITDSAARTLTYAATLPESPEEFGLDPDDENYVRDAVLRIAEDMRAYGKANGIVIEMEPQENCFGDVIGLHLTDFFADEPGRGAGTAAMQRLTALADVLSVGVCLYPSSSRNKEFYQRFGFEMTRAAFGMMQRLPPVPEYLLFQTQEEDSAPCP